MATIPVFRTWTAGEVVTAAYMNSNVRDAGNFFLSWPVFEGLQTVAQSLANATPTGLLIDTNIIDTDGGHSTVTNPSRYTGKTAGRFQLFGGCSFAANGTGIRLIEYAKNGTTPAGTDVIGYLTAGTSARICGRLGTYFLNGSTDYLEVLVYQSAGGALSTSVVSAEQPSMSVRMVGIS